MVGGFNCHRSWCLPLFTHCICCLLSILIHSLVGCTPPKLFSFRSVISEENEGRGDFLTTPHLWHPENGGLIILMWVWVNTYRYIFSGMNIHLPAILGFTRGTRFWPIPILMCLKMENFNYPKWRIFPGRINQPWFEATEATRTSLAEDGSTEFRFWVLKVALWMGPFLWEFCWFCGNWVWAKTWDNQPNMAFKKRTKMIANEDTAKSNRIDLANMSMWLYHNIQLYPWISVEFGPLRVQSTQLDIFWYMLIFLPDVDPKRGFRNSFLRTCFFFSFQLATSDFQVSNGASFFRRRSISLNIECHS